MLLNEDLFLEYVDDEKVNGWVKVTSKDVKDSDGFMTEYTWYKDSNGNHIFIFGDSDLYGPDDTYADAEFDSEEAAQEWFDNYFGFDYDPEDPDFVEFAEERPAELEEATEDDPMAKLARKHNLEILSPMDTEPGSMRIAGTVRDLDNFYREAEETGLLKLEETLTMHDFDEFKEIAKEVGLVTAGDLETFRAEEMQPGESELDAIKRYRDELIDAGVDLTSLRNESLQEGTVKELSQDVQDAKDNENDFIQILKDKLVPLKKELNYLEDYARREVGRGGAFDSIEEVDEAIEEVKEEIAQVTSKLALLLK